MVVKKLTLSFSLTRFFAAKRYILQQKCLKGQICYRVSCPGDSLVLCTNAAVTTARSFQADSTPRPQDAEHSS